MGLASALAPTLADTLATLEQTRSAYFANPAFIGSDFARQTCAFRDSEEVSSFPQRLRALMAEALGDLLDRAALSHSQLTGMTTEIVLNLPEPAPWDGLDPDRLAALAQELTDDAADIVRGHGFLRPGATHSTRSGAAGGLLAAGAVAHHGRSTILLCLDSYSDRSRLTALADRGLLFSKEHSFGFVPGEAGAALLLARASSQLGAPVAEVLGVGQASEPDGEFDDRDSVFTGLSDAAFAALDAARVKVGVLVSDWNGSRYRSGELSYALHRINAPYLIPGTEPEHPSPVFGDCGAAYLGTALVSAARTSAGRTDPSSALLLGSSPMARERAALVLGPLPDRIDGRLTNWG